MDFRFLLICLLFLVSPASALFLAGQSGPGGGISVLCEGQQSVFVSLPDGSSHRLELDASSQAIVYPLQSSPYTFQCGNETKTVIAKMPASEGGLAAGGESTMPAVALLSAAFLLAAFFASRHFSVKRTEFSKSADGTLVMLSVKAACDLHGITITDPDSGEDGKPLVLKIANLPAGSNWSWEYELRGKGAPLAPASMSARCGKGELNILSSMGGPNDARPACPDAGKKPLPKI